MKTLTVANHVHAEVQVLATYMSTDTCLVALRSNPAEQYEVDRKALTDIKTYDLDMIFNR